MMPNHAHLMLQLPNDQTNLNTVISNAKRFMAYSLVQRLTEQCNDVTLYMLSSACSEKEKAKGQNIKYSSRHLMPSPFILVNFYIKNLIIYIIILLEGNGIFVMNIRIISIVVPYFMNWKSHIHMLISQITGSTGPDVERRVLSERPCGNGYGPFQENLRKRNSPLTLIRPAGHTPSPNRHRYVRVFAYVIRVWIYYRDPGPPF